MENYEIEFKIKGLVVCKPDTFLTGEMKIFKQDTKNHEFSILIAEQDENSEEAVKTALYRLELFLAYYNLFFEQPLHIVNDGKPFSVTKVKDGKIIGETYSLRLNVGPFFIYSEDLKNHTIEVLKLLSQPRNRYLRVAVDYYRRAGLERDGINELINIFISLEALYATKNEKQEIQYRFSNRISTLIGKDKSHRIELRKRAKILYNLRSKIVHGTEITEGSNFEDLVNWTQESILRFLVIVNKHPKAKHEDIIELIDEAMLDNEYGDKLREESNDLIRMKEESKKKAKEEEMKIKESENEASNK